VSVRTARSGICVKRNIKFKQEITDNFRIFFLFSFTASESKHIKTSNVNNRMFTQMDNHFSFLKSCETSELHKGDETNTNLFAFSAEN
jgi:hypothetical protein